MKLYMKEVWNSQRREELKVIDVYVECHAKIRVLHTIAFPLRKKKNPST